MAAVGGAALAGSASGIADQAATDAGKTALDAANSFFKMKKAGRDMALGLI